MKYREDVNMEKALEYIKGTYGEHYVGDDPKATQTLDLLHGAGDLIPFCRGNIVKLGSRFGKKSPLGSPEARKDLHKTIHYCLVLLHFTEPLPEEHKMPDGVTSRIVGGDSPLLLRDEFEEELQ